MGTIALSSHFSAPEMGGVSFTGMDKVVHFLLYGLLATVWYEYWKRQPVAPVYSWILAFVMSSGFGVLDEFHQAFRPTRSFEYADMGADMLGAAVALGVYQVGLYRRILHARVW